jgi:hypothetical protein
VENIPVVGTRFDIALDADGDMQVTGLPAELRLVTTRRLTPGAPITTPNHDTGH